jgi:hypothetical protein
MEPARYHTADRTVPAPQLNQLSARHVEYELNGVGVTQVDSPDSII